MDRMKTFLKYAAWFILFFIFSEVMISLNLETVYKNIGRKDNLSQVIVYQAQATKVNGRIKGTIYNDSNNKITNKYLRIDIYSARDVFLGSKYIDVSDMEEDEKREFEVFFKVQNVNYYEAVFTDEKEEKGELPQMLKDLTKGEVILAVLFLKVMFW